MVRPPGPAVAENGDAARARAVRPPSAARSRLYGRRRRAQAGLYPSEDAPNAFPRGIRAHCGRGAAVALLGRGPPPHHRALLAPAKPGGLMSARVLIIDDE